MLGLSNNLNYYQLNDNVHLRKGVSCLLPLLQLGLANEEKVGLFQ